eukprot:1337403-Karenia_brevis.AAC.1
MSRIIDVLRVMRTVTAIVVHGLDCHSLLPCGTDECLAVRLNSHISAAVFRTIRRQRHRFKVLACLAPVYRVLR